PSSTAATAASATSTGCTTSTPPTRRSRPARPGGGCGTPWPTASPAATNGSPSRKPGWWSPTRRAPGACCWSGSASTPAASPPAGRAERVGRGGGGGRRGGRRLLAFVGGRGDRRKGFAATFDAWSALAREPGWDAVLLVIGRGAELPAWRARAEAAGLAD